MNKHHSYFATGPGSDREAGSLRLAASALAVLLPASWAVAAGSMAPGPTDARPVARVVVAPVKEEELRATTTGFGQVQAQPAKVVSIDAPEAATVSKVFVRPGQTVPQGQPVAELSAAPATRQAYQTAKTALEFARTKLARTQYLWDRGATIKDTLDQAKIAFRDAQANIDALQRIGAQNPQQTIAAPILGTVTAVSVAEGDRVAQNAKILSMTPVDTLAVLLGVEPEDVKKVQVGLRMTLTPAFDSNAKYSGKVSALNEVIDPQTRLVDVLVDIDDSGSRPLLIGTMMRGEIELRRERTLAVPRAAVLYDAQGPYVFTVQDGQAHRVPIKPGLDGNGVIGVTGPIKAGDTVVVQGNYELGDGMKVTEIPHAVP